MIHCLFSLKSMIYNYVKRLENIYITLAYRPAMRTFQLALRGYWVTSLPRASRSHLALPFEVHENFREEKSVTQLTRNALIRIEMQK